MNTIYIVIIGLVSAAWAVQYHHYRKHRYWFDRSDMDCHEIWFVGLITMAIGMIISSHLS